MPASAQQTSALGEQKRTLVKVEFTLTDHNGKSVSQRTYRGKWMLIFFGFTRCPDICPTALNTVAEIMDRLGEESASIQPLFITLDAERDTVDDMATYVGAFNSSIVGLTGTVEQVSIAAKNFRVHYAKTEGEDMPGGYSIAHSGFMYLINPKGEFEMPLVHQMGIEQILAAIKEKLERKN